MAIHTDLYDIEYFEYNNLLCVEIRGIFDVESHNEYTRDLLLTARSANNNNIKILCDLSKASTQPKEISKDNGYMFELEKYVHKTAIIIVSTLYKLQLQRSANGPALQYFDDIDLARKWLESE